MPLTRRPALPERRPHSPRVYRPYGSWNRRSRRQAGGARRRCIESFLLVRRRHPAGGPCTSRSAFPIAMPRPGGRTSRHRSACRRWWRSRRAVLQTSPRGTQPLRLIGVGMGHIEVIRLGPRRTDFVAEVLLGNVRRSLDDGVVVAHPDDLDDPSVTPRGRHRQSVRTSPSTPPGRRVGRLDPAPAIPRPCRARPRAQNDFSKSTIGVTSSLRSPPLFDHGHIPVDEETAVERGDRRRECERLDQHRHPSRWTATRDRGAAHPPGRGDGPQRPLERSTACPG